MSTAFIFKNKSLSASGLIEMHHFNYANSKYSSNSKYGTYTTSPLYLELSKFQVSTWIYLEFGLGSWNVDYFTFNIFSVGLRDIVNPNSKYLIQIPSKSKN